MLGSSDLRTLVASCYYYSKALVTSSEALVTSSFLLLLVRHLLLVARHLLLEAMHLLLVAFFPADGNWQVQAAGCARPLGVGGLMKDGGPSSWANVTWTRAPRFGVVNGHPYNL